MVPRPDRIDPAIGKMSVVDLLRMPEPGAATSTARSPKLEKDARRPADVVAATATMLLSAYSVGNSLKNNESRSWPSLPAAVTNSCPFVPAYWIAL